MMVMMMRVIIRDVEFDKLNVPGDTIREVGEEEASRYITIL